jgi:hypothetical protein
VGLFGCVLRENRNCSIVRNNKLPVARYLIFVGGTLAALLFIPGWLLPIPPTTSADQSIAFDRAVIRIKSAHRWPEQVILDTSQPTITPPAVMDSPVIQPSILLPSTKVPDQSNLEATALLQSNTQPATANHPIPQFKLGRARIARSRRAARGHVIRRRTLVRGDCCKFGWGDSGQTSLNAMPFRRAVSSWRLD